MTDQFNCWRKSSYSGNGGNCVEVGVQSTNSTMGVRDTKSKGPALAFSKSDWTAFIADVSNGGFDR